MAYRLILWDFDGTLADTLAGSLRIYNELADRYGFRRVVDPEVARNLSMTAFLKAHGVPLLKVPRLMREFLRCQKSLVGECPLDPQLGELVVALQQAEQDMGVVSSNNEENIRTYLERHGLGACFRFVAGYSRLQGKHRGIRQALKAGRTAARDALYIGDEVRDIEAARHAGVDVAAVAWGFNARALLEKHRPTYLIDTPADLRRLLSADLKSRPVTP